MIAERNALEQQHFWDSFESEFGPIGREPAAYYDYRIAHVMHIQPSEMWCVSPEDIMGALNVFNATWKPSD